MQLDFWLSAWKIMYGRTTAPQKPKYDFSSAYSPDHTNILRLININLNIDLNIDITQPGTK